MERRNVKLVKNTFVLGIGTLCTKGIMFFMTPLFTVWLSSSDYGLFDLLVTYISLATPILTLSSGEAIFRFIISSKDKKYKTSIISTVFIIDLIGIGLFFIGSILFRVIYKPQFIIVLGFCMYLFTEIIYNFCMMSMRGLKKLNLYTVGNISFVIGLAFFVSLFVKYFDFGLGGILLGYAFGDIIAIIIMVLFSGLHKFIKLSMVSLCSAKSILQYSIPMIPNSLSWWIINVADRSLISVVLGASSNAIYAVSNKIPGLCQTLFGIFHLSWQQSATETLNDADRDKFYSDILNKMFQKVVSICILVLNLNYPFYVILFSKEYFPGYFQVPLLILSIVFSMLAQFLGGIYVAQMKSKKNGYTTVLAAVINLLVNISLIKTIGLYSASLSTLVAYFILFWIRYYDVKKNIKLRFYKESNILMGVLIYFILSSYVINLSFILFNMILGVSFFILINKDMLFLFCYKIFKKR